MLLPLGSLVNAGAILAGGAVGLALGARLPAGVRSIVFQGLGLCTLALGLKMAITFTAPLVVFFSILLGGVLGAAIKLEEKLCGLGDRLKNIVKSTNEKFTDGLISAFLLFCIGSMTILGAFDEGLRGDPTIYYTKSLLDGFASIALASTYGIGVLFSALPVFAYQYGLTLFAAQFQDLLSPAVMNELTAVGGILIMGIGINLLEIKYVKLGDLLPSLLVVVVLGSFLL